MIAYEEKTELAVDYLVQWLRIKAPKDTFNLALNGIRKAWNPDTWNWEVVIGGETAPYAVYTNEEWLARPGVNPNQAWIQKACQEAKPILVAILGGILSREDYEKLKNNNTNALAEQLKAGGIQ